MPREYFSPKEARHPDPREQRVVTHQPRMGMAAGQQFPPRDWSSGLFDCTDDMRTCKLIVILHYTSDTFAL